MSSAALSRSRRIGFGWLLGWLLLLPLAQSVAAWHEVSHLGESDTLTAPAPHDDAPLPHHAACALCLAAAAIGAGGLPAMTVALPLAAPDARRVRVPVTKAAAWVTPPVAAYRSRAPPQAAA